MKKYYAHSGLKKWNIPPQPYQHHVQGAISRLDYLDLNKDEYDIIKYLLIFHDIGKLDDSIQNVLSQDDTQTGIHILNHVEAGVVYMLEKYKQTQNLFYIYCAWLIHSHHIGLQDKDEILDINVSTTGMFKPKTIVNIKERFKDNRSINEFIKTEFGTINSYIKKNISTYVNISKQVLKDEHIFIDNFENNLPIFKTPSSMNLRLLLSYIVECDHYDTSKNYGYTPKDDKLLNPKECLNNLEGYVHNLSKQSKKTKRQKARDSFFEECGTSSYDRFNLMDGSVGLGKTFGGLRYALRIADDNNLKRIFTIAPFINIISQIVNEYKKSINKDDISFVNEIHSKCEFDHYVYKKYSTLWSSPINVSTALQFFETITGNKPSNLRKLHNFRDSVIILEEFHTAIPHEFWKLTLEVLKSMSKELNIYFIFTSGSPVRYWDIFKTNNISFVNVIKGNKYIDMIDSENKRVETILYKQNICDIDILVDKVITESKNKKSTLIITNTIVTSYSIFKRIKQRVNKKTKVYNISSALTPKDKESLLEDIKTNIKNKLKVYVVSTSIIECGIDISFDTGFRETCSYESVIQTLGRINRGYKNKTSKLFLYGFNTQCEHIIPNYQMKIPSEITYDIINKHKKTSQEYCSDAVEEYFNRRGKSLKIKINELCKLDIDKQYNTLNSKYRVISGDQINVIVDENIYKQMKSGININWTSIQRNNISLMESKKRLKLVEERCEHIVENYYYCKIYDKYNGGVGSLLIDS